MQDYVSFVKLLQPDLAVAPIEDIDVQANGTKKISRVVRHSLLVFEDIQAMDKHTQWVAPVVIEEPKMTKAIAETTPILMYGGQTMKSSALFDNLREICTSSQKRVKGLAYGDPTSLVLGLLAGIDFFETDYPLDLASKNQALLLDADWSPSDEHLQSLRKSVSPALAQDTRLMLAVECGKRQPRTIDVSKQLSPDILHSKEPL